MDTWKSTIEWLRKTYLGKNRVESYLWGWLTSADSWRLYSFQSHLKRYENLQYRKAPFRKLRMLWHLRGYQKHARLLGFSIGDGVLGDRVLFYHPASIIINPDARVGNGCRFHGNCCIGVRRTGERGCPVLGENVDIGFGAVILGDIYIADNCTIGANAVVTQSCYEPGATIAGIPARIISKRTTPEE